MFIHYFQLAYSLIKYMTSVGSYVGHSILLFDLFALILPVQFQLQESEEVYVQAERRISQLKSSLDDKEREACSTAKKLEEALAASTGKEQTIRQLEEAVQRYS